MNTGVLPWKSLTAEEEKTYRQWARDHYKLMEPINGVWHPVVQAECVLMNKDLPTQVECVLPCGHIVGQEDGTCCGMTEGA